MGIRPGKCYRSLKDRAYTRLAVRVHKRNYIGAAPGLKTRQFNMGDPSKPFTHIIDLIAQGSVQVRDNAVESSRIAINRQLQKKLGKEGYFLKIRVYPFQLLRENKQAQGAGADRTNTGMSHSFGKVIGRAVRVKKGMKILSALVMEQSIESAKEAVLRARSRMPCKFSVKVGTDVKSIGSLPSKRRLEEMEKEAEAVEKKEAELKVEKKEEKVEEKKEVGKEGKAGEEKKAEKKEGKAVEEKKEVEKGKRGKGKA